MAEVGFSQQMEAPSAENIDGLEEGGEPWVLRLGNWLSTPKGATMEGKPWAVRLGSYLNEKQPGPWSLIANEKPQDPLVLRLGTFLNETKPIGVLHNNQEPLADDQPPAKPLVLRLGNYLNGNNGNAGVSTPAASVAMPPAAIPSPELPVNATREAASVGTAPLAVEPPLPTSHAAEAPALPLTEPEAKADAAVEPASEQVRASEPEAGRQETMAETVVEAVAPDGTQKE